MKILFVDTNVLIDFLADRRPFSISAAKLFSLALSMQVKLYISAVSFNNIYYILRQTFTHKETIRLLSELAAMAETVAVTKEVIEKALKSDFNDFEDAIQYHCALAISNVEMIVTRNTKDYKKSSIPVISSQEIIIIIENMTN